MSDGDFHDNDTITVFVNPNRAPVAVPKLETEEELGIPLTFNGTTSFDPDGDGIRNYYWEFGDGDIAQGPVVNHSFLVSGEINVTLTVFDGLDNGTETISLDIPLNEPPTGSIWKAMYIFDNRNYKFYSQDLNDPENMNIEISWYMGDGTQLQGQVVNHTYQEAGIYTIRMVITDELGGTHEESETFEVMDSSIYLPETYEVNGNLTSEHGVQEGYYHEIVETTWYGMTPRITVTQVPEGGARYYRLNLSRAVYNISVKVVSGGNIDVLLMDPSNKDEYAAYNLIGEQRFIDWDRSGSDLNTKQISFQYHANSLRFLVIGNNGKMAGGAEPTGNVRYNISIEWSRPVSSPPITNNDPEEIDKENRSMAMLLFILCFGIPIFFIAGIFVIFVVVKMREKREKLAADGDRANMNDRVGPSILPPPPTSDEGLGIGEWMNEETLPDHLMFENEETYQVDQFTEPEMTDINDLVLDEIVSNPFPQFEDDGGTNIDALFTDQENVPSDIIDEFGHDEEGEEPLV